MVLGLQSMHQTPFALPLEYGISLSDGSAPVQAVQ